MGAFCLEGPVGLAHILHARNFAIGNKLPSEDFLETCRRHASPMTRSVCQVPETQTGSQVKGPTRAGLFT
jgi:hypothetical protein